MQILHTLLLVRRDQRIRELCAQLLRTHNPEVIQLVADQLKSAIDEYVSDAQNDFPVLEFFSLRKPADPEGLR